MKRILAGLLVVFVCISLMGCSLAYDSKLCAVNGFDVGYSKLLKDAFLSAYNWDGTDEGMKIVIPEKYDGYTITSFGGYYGRGVPCSTVIQPTDEVKEKLCSKALEWYHMYYGINTLRVENTETFIFDVHVSKNIKEIESLSLGGFIGAMYMKDGEEAYDIFALLCNVTCDEENEVFYAVDGKLYYKENDALVTDILYYDFDVESHMQEEQEGDVGFTAF